MLTDMRLFFNRRYTSVPNLHHLDKVCFGMGHLGGVLSRKPCIFIASSSIREVGLAKTSFLYVCSSLLIFCRLQVPKEDSKRRFHCVLIFFQNKTQPKSIFLNLRTYKMKNLADYKLIKIFQHHMVDQSKIHVCAKIWINQSTFKP